MVCGFDPRRPHHLRMKDAMPNQHDIYFGQLQEFAKRSKEQLHLIPHNAERGRALEGVISQILGEILPKRFSLGTGFVINSAGERSAQQDIVIFDHIYNAPLLSSAACSLFPVECVYGTVEVKSTLTKKTLRDALQSVVRLRKIGATRKYLLTVPCEEGSKIVYKSVPAEFSVPPRSYLVAFKASGLGSGERLAETIEGICREEGAHIHGICILESDFFGYIRPYSGITLEPSFGYALANLYSAILQQSTNRPIFQADMAHYLSQSAMNVDMNSSPSTRSDLVGD